MIATAFFRHAPLHAIPLASDNGQFGHLAFVAFLPRDMAREVLVVAAGEVGAIVCAAAEFFPHEGTILGYDHIHGPERGAKFTQFYFRS
jgi:hypothetical protein